MAHTVASPFPSLSLSHRPPLPHPLCPLPFSALYSVHGISLHRVITFIGTRSLFLSLERENLSSSIFFSSPSHFFSFSRIEKFDPLDQYRSSRLASRRRRRRGGEREREGCETSNSLLHSGRGRRRCEKRRFWQEDPWRARSARREERFGTKGRRSAREQRERGEWIDGPRIGLEFSFVPFSALAFFFPPFFFFFFFPLVERALAALRRVEKKARFFPRYTSVLFALWNACYR